MIDLTPYEGIKQYADLVDEIRKLRDAGSRLAEVAQMVAADAEPVHPDSVTCEHLDHKKAIMALAAWKAL